MKPLNERLLEAANHVEALTPSAAKLMREAADVLVVQAEMSKKLTFDDLAIGDRFISWPVPGDNSGHGGYLGAQRLFVKTSAKVPEAEVHASGAAVDGRGVELTIPFAMTVIKVMLT